MSDRVPDLPLEGPVTGTGKYYSGMYTVCPNCGGERVTQANLRDHLEHRTEWRMHRFQSEYTAAELRGEA